MSCIVTYMNSATNTNTNTADAYNNGTATYWLIDKFDRDGVTVEVRQAGNDYRIVGTIDGFGIISYVDMTDAFRTVLVDEINRVVRDAISGAEADKVVREAREARKARK
jgi:hypothetical protein